jgi:hypothetical protein
VRCESHTTLQFVTEIGCDKLNSDPENTAKQLLRDDRWESSFVGRLRRSLLFRLGCSQCRYCIHCRFDGDSYKEIRESRLGGGTTVRS